jgi:ADP-glucose pyrophosphorylase
MAFLDEEIEWFKKTADEMAQRIEDHEKTSEQAAVIFSGIGRLCTRAVAAHAAAEAKKAMRSSQATKFQTARQTRRERKKQKSNGTAHATSTV